MFEVDVKNVMVEEKEKWRKTQLGFVVLINDPSQSYLNSLDS